MCYIMFASAACVCTFLPVRSTHAARTRFKPLRSSERVNVAKMSRVFSAVPPNCERRERRERIGGGSERGGGLLKL